jgi:hypothetical protein
MEENKEGWDYRQLVVKYPSRGDLSTDQAQYRIKAA